MSDYTQSLVRNIGQLSAGILASRGLIKEDQTELLAGIVVGVAMVAWSMWHQYQHKSGKIPPDEPTVQK